MFIHSDEMGVFLMYVWQTLIFSGLLLIYDRWTKFAFYEVLENLNVKQKRINEVAR